MKKDWGFYCRQMPTILASFLLTICATSAAADEPQQIVREPGYRPDSEFAAAFLDAVGNTSIDVLPTMVHRAGRTAHSFASQQLIVDFLNDNGIAAATSRPYRIDLGNLQRRSQWDLFQRGMAATASTVSNQEAVASYVLVMELLVPDDQQIFGIHVYILDQQGRNAFSFLLNAHHQLFDEASLAASDTSEVARERMLANATHTGLVALQAQIKRAEECAQRAAVSIPKTSPGMLHDFDGNLLSGADKHGNLLGYSTFNGPKSRVSFTTTDNYPPRVGTAPGNRVLQLDLDVTSWGGVIHRFTNKAADQWTSYDWRELDGFSFWFLGTNSGARMFVHIFDNRNTCSQTDDAERFGYEFWDDVAGWRLVKARFVDLTRQQVGNDAPNDGFNLEQVHGWGIGTMNTNGAVTLYVDQFRLLDDATDVAFQPEDLITHRLFTEIRLSDTISKIETSTQLDGSLAVERILGLTCACTRLAIDRGYAYFRMDQRELLSNERARFRLTFYKSRPTDISVQEIPESFEAEGFTVDVSAAIPVGGFRTLCQPYWDNQAF
jgi:hypothetical protein